MIATHSICLTIWILHAEWSDRDSFFFGGGNRFSFFSTLAFLCFDSQVRHEVIKYADWSMADASTALDRAFINLNLGRDVDPIWTPHTSWDVTDDEPSDHEDLENSTKDWAFNETDRKLLRHPEYDPNCLFIDVTSRPDPHFDRDGDTSEEQRDVAEMPQIFRSQLSRPASYNRVMTYFDPVPVQSESIFSRRPVLIAEDITVHRLRERDNAWRDRFLSRLQSAERAEREKFRKNGPLGASAPPKPAPGLIDLRVCSIVSSFLTHLSFL